jgi:hypothetical protein
MPHGTLTNPTVVPSSRHYRFRVRANARYKLSHKLGDISVHLDNHRMNSFSMDTAMVYSHAAGKGSCLCADPADLRYPPTTLATVCIATLPQLNNAAMQATWGEKERDDYRL